VQVRDPGSYAIAVVAITLVYQWPVVYLIGTRRWASNMAILVCLGLCLAYHLRHSRSRRHWGFSRRSLLPGLRLVGAFTVPAASAFLGAGYLLESLRWRDDPLPSFAFLLVWALAQQLALHTLVLRTLETRVSAPALAAGLVFALLHLPNPFLVPLTFLAGWTWCGIYRRHPHLLPLALSHAVGSFTILSSLPRGVTGGMRVGYSWFLL
jgi:membrane protease YdiL (CAAX protease family)